MQLILSIAVTLTFVLTMFQCDQNNLNNTAAAAQQNTAANNQPTQTAATPDDGAARITLAEAKADYDAGKAIFIDSRGAESYKAEHIKGAINITLGEFEAKYKSIPTDKKIIVYCS
jgi:3-mercaptopyruvate sulfurtransferase SseA